MSGVVKARDACCADISEGEVSMKSVFKTEGHLRLIVDLQFHLKCCSEGHAKSKLE